MAYFLLFYYVGETFSVSSVISVSCFPRFSNFFFLKFGTVFIVSLALFFRVRTSSSFIMSSVEGFGDGFVFPFGGMFS